MLAFGTLLRFPLCMLPMNFSALYAFENGYAPPGRGIGLSKKIFQIKTTSAFSFLKNVENNEECK